MSTTEVLRTLVDNLRHQVNKLQAKKVKLKADRTGEESSNESELEAPSAAPLPSGREEDECGSKDCGVERTIHNHDQNVENLREELEG